MSQLQLLALQLRPPIVMVALATARVLMTTTADHSLWPAACLRCLFHVRVVSHA